MIHTKPIFFKMARRTGILKAKMFEEVYNFIAFGAPGKAGRQHSTMTGNLDSGESSKTSSASS